MAEEILISPASARNAVDAISKIISQLEWPPKDKKVFWEKTYEELISKNKSDVEIQISESEYKRLHKLLERYFATKDFSVISSFSRNLKMICSSLDSAFLYEPVLTDEKCGKKLDFLLSDISKNPKIFESVVLPLLKVNLRSENGITLLKKYLPGIFSHLNNSVNDDLQKINSNLPIYIDKNFLFQKLTKTTSATFKDSLSEIGILEKLCSSANKYFTSEFFPWLVNRIMKSQNLSLAFILRNFELIKQCTADEEKIIQAVFITKLYEQKLQNSFEEIQQLIDLMQMKNADEEFYWQVTNKNLQEKFKTILAQARTIVRTMITTDFISYVFRFLGSNFENDQRRIRFWRMYAGSVADFKIFYSRYEKSKFQNIVLRQNTQKSKIYADVINSHSLIDSGENGEIALIFKFEKLIIVEFPKSGKPVQIYQMTNKIARLFEPRRTYAYFDDIRQYKDNIPYERFSENRREGTFAHRGSWEFDLAQILSNYRIFTDKDLL